MIPVSQGKPYAGNPHVRFEEGASAQAAPRRSALLHTESLAAPFEPCGDVIEADADGLLDFSAETENQPSCFFKIEIVP